MTGSPIFFWLFLVLSSICMFATGYGLVTWWQVRGLRGLATTTLSLSLSLIFSATAWSHSDDARISIFTIMAVTLAASATATLSIFVLADLYAASANSHRAVTTKLYLWFQNMKKERSGEQA